MEEPKYSITESVDNNGRNDLLSGESRRGRNESAGKQAGRISSYKQEIEGKTRAERQSAAKEILDKGFTEEKIDGAHKYNLVKPEGYNDDMKAIVAKAKESGKEVGFFIGAAQRKFGNFLVDGIMLSDNKILLRYDGEFAPQTLLEHEDVHTEWYTPEMQAAKDEILGRLTEKEKQEILSRKRYKDYMALYKNEDAVWQEFVADVFAGMNDYADDFVDVVADYAKGDKAIDSYNAAEYNEIMDAGGNDAVLDNIGFGDESYIAYSIAKWHPDLSRQRLEILDNEIKKDSKTGKNYITDTAKWLYEEDIDGINVLAIYSIEDSEGPTLLYESKGKKAKFEKRILELLSEEYNYGRSNDRQSKNLNEILSGSRLQQGYSVQNSADIMGRGSGNGNAEILQGSSRRNPSRAFRNVIENLFEIQDENRNNSGDGRGIGKYPKEKD